MHAQVRTFRADPSCVAGGGFVPCTRPVSGDSLRNSFLTFGSRENSVPSHRPALKLFYKR